MALESEPARTLGYIEGRITELAAAVQDLREGLQQVNQRIDVGLQQVNSRIDAGLQQINQRIDRLFLAILGIGGAILTALIVLIIRGL